MQEEAGGWKENCPLESPYPIQAAVPCAWWVCQSEAQDILLDEFWRTVWLITGPVYEAGGVAVSAISCPCASHCLPFLHTQSRHQLGQEEVVAVPELRCWAI